MLNAYCIVHWSSTCSKAHLNPNHEWKHFYPNWKIFMLESSFTRTDVHSECQIWILLWRISAKNITGIYLQILISCKTVKNFEITFFNVKLLLAQFDGSHLEVVSSSKTTVFVAEICQQGLRRSTLPAFRQIHIQA